MSATIIIIIYNKKHKDKNNNGKKLHSLVLILDFKICITIDNINWNGIVRILHRPNKFDLYNI